MQVTRRTVIVVGVSALVIGLFFGYAFVTYAGVAASRGAGPTREGLSVEGYGIFQVLNSKGQVVREWSGYNSLTPQGIDAIAECLASATIPSQFASCSPITNQVYVVWLCPNNNCGSAVGIITTGNTGVNCTNANNVAECEAYALANTVTMPSGCGYGVNLNKGGCTGWVVTATFDPGAFTTTNCATSGSTCTIGIAGASNSGGSSNAEGISFDELYPSTLAIGPADTLQATITFTVS